MNPAAVHAYLVDLQNRLVAELERVEGRSFRRDHWQRSEGGGGESRIIEGGDVFERGGVNFSRVHGARRPPSASAARPGLAGRALGPAGWSLGLHPRNPFPTASASATFRPIAAAATSSSISSTIAARCSACSRPAAPSRY